ncbi:MAG: response regulator [Ignavibacteria bacterium]
MLSLPGYRVVEELPLRGSARAIAHYRGLRRGDGVAVSILTAPTGSDEAVRLAREHAFGAELDIPGIVAPLACETHGGTVVLVRAECGGSPLAELIPTGGMPLLQALRVAAGVARALDELHRRQRLHLGVTPDSVLVDPSGQAYLTDLWQASTAGRDDGEERRAPANPAYMAPEQTGRTGIEVGPGADLYALGILLFQMLTGELPFRVKDPLDWIHCHIARVPAAPRSLRTGIPVLIERMVLKLLAKTPEERYRSASGLAWDLLECAARIETGGDWEGFRLGTRDTAPTLAMPAHLYGRDNQRAALFDAWQRTAGGRAELLLIAGPAGLGKSALVQELQPAVAQSGGHFVAGKFDERNRATPYSSLIQALQDLVRQVLAESDEQLAHWRAKLHHALGANGQVIVDTVGQAGLVLGPQPALQDLPPAQSTVRFQRSLHDFVCAFAEPDRPLVVFLDDLQWADTATLELLRHGLADPDTRHLLVIGAYRDNEVDDAHPLHAVTRHLAGCGVPCRTLSLAPLSEADVAGLIADTLHTHDAGELVRLVLAKSAGNPLFVRQFLLNLYDEGLLGYDTAQRRWTWDLARIDAAELGEDAAELMAQRLRRLSPAAQRALQIAACIGNRFAADTVGAAALGCGEGEAEIATGLAEALHEGLIGEVLGAPGGNVLRFAHDRIQQAAYGMLGEGERTAAHLAAGRALLADADAHADRIFDIANQFQYCIGEVVDPDERRRLVAVFARAGMRAKAAAANAAARAYLATASDLAGSDIWQRDRALAMQLFVDRAECEFLCGHPEIAEALFVRVLERTVDAGDVARLYVLRMHLYMSQGRSDRAVEAGRQGLMRLGVRLPAAPGKATLLAELMRIGAGLRGRRIEDLAALPDMSDPLQQAVMHLYMNITVAAYFVNRDLLALVAMRMVSVSMRHGNTGSSAYAYVTFGMVIGGGFARYRDGYRFGELGRRLGEMSGDVRYQGLARSMCGIFTGAWGQPLSASIIQLRRAGRDLLDCGNLMMANYCAIATVFALDGKGEPLPSLAAEAQREADFVRKIGFNESAHYFLSTQRKALCLQGETAAPASLDGPEYDESAQVAAMRAMTERTALAWHLVNRLQVCYLFGHLAEAKAAADELETMREVSIAQLYVPRQLFYSALAELGLAAAAQGLVRRRHLRLAGRYGRRLHALAESCPANYRHLDLLVAAEHFAVATLDGAGAAHRFERAVALAADTGHTQDWALANERAAENFRRHGMETAAGQYLRNACHGYRQWGAIALAEEIESRHAELATVAAGAPEAAGPDAAPIDMAAVIKASQALSGEIEFGGLLRRLMEALAVHAGAARVVFILKRDAGLQIEDEWRAGEDAPQCLGPMPLERCEDIAHTVVHYAARTLSDVVIDDAARDAAFTADGYLSAGDQKSLLCLPIVRHGSLLGLLYMENPLLRGAFHRERMRVLQLLTGQLAISIENANLYERLKRASLTLEEANRGLEEKVAARTRELSDEIAERKRIEAALREASSAAEAANRAKSAFLANMSHEIRTPMNAIIGLVQLCLRTELTPKQYSYLKKIDGAAELLLGLINDTLDMAKIEAGKMSLEAIPFSIDEVVTRVADTIEMAAQEKGLELVVHRSRESPCLLVGDPLRLGQVLLNLASNAVKFTASGEVSLSVERERFDEASGEIVLRFSVTDTGMGISNEQLGKLFQPFSQADMSVTRTHGGTGLGLTIVKELVQLMGGKVEVASAPGVGSDFSFAARFRIAPAAADVDKNTAPNYTGLRVLVVDDNDSARLALQHVLENAGCRVTAVSGGAEAIAELRAAAADSPYQLVMMDWNMPGMDGVETTRRIKADSQIPRQPVVVMVTAYSRDEVAARASRLETPIDAFLLKPVKPPVLYRTIGDMFGAEPESREPAPAAGGAAIAEPVAAAGGRLLVVEDNAYNQLVARELLEGAGFSVDIAENGREAVDRVLHASVPFDAVLMDVQMPVMDGWAATRVLRQYEQGRSLPIIGMTAFTMTEDLDRCREAGMDDVITKPVRLDKLLRVLNAVIGQGSRASVPLPAPSEPIEPVLALIDVQGALDRLGSNRELLRRLLADFRASEGDTAQRVQALVAAGKIEEASRLVHTIKGTAMILGLDRFTAVAAEMERNLRQGDLPGYEALRSSFARERAVAVVACAQPLAGRARAAVGATPPARSLPPAGELQPLLDRFVTLLDRSSMAALEIVPQLRDMLHGSPHHDTIVEINASLERLDFAAARKRAGQLTDELTSGA